ncbi:UvrD-helicase domain-containing protein [Comamonas aquatica]|uniref:UvrD-helicase domain-containing protein n=1 Tax=Comamonas aquatica TaxID=225991 RepID=UPI0022DDD5BC|nr:UvrD-helicase domain-containing protein [Comamonas aquatica]WBM40629.1 UvrD-helicase domain-containing protein [Comamonas aquatica]
MIEYILFDKKVCEIIVQDRFLQNIGFDSAKSLVNFFRNPNKEFDNFLFKKFPKGVVVYTKNSTDEDDSIVFDLTTLTLNKDCNDQELLQSIQKTLRFCIKYWNGLGLSSGERFLKGSNKCLVFPLSYVANRMGYRITLEKDPIAKRLSKRTDSKFLLAYKSGTSEGEGATEVVSFTVFRKAYEDYVSFTSGNDFKVNAVAKSSSSVLDVTSLDESSRKIENEQGYERWLHLLTDSQKKFVTSDWKKPHRLEGPAGTGKTLSLALKAVSVLKDAAAKGVAHNSVFIAPSDEVVEIIKRKIASNDGYEFLGEFDENKKQLIEVITLQKLCAKLLNYDIDDSEFLDRDSVESKNVQLLYLVSIIENIKKNEINAIRGILSKELVTFLESEDVWALAKMLMHEISVVIKGRANASIESYKNIPALEYGFPLIGEKDKEFIYSKFSSYQSNLEKSNQYDIDDVVISAIGQLDTPIWRRRRKQMGYDSIFVDEVHLFNLNEISIFHFLSKEISEIPISYSIDRTQAVGDIGWNDRQFHSALGAVGDSEVEHQKISAVFRSSPYIVDLAFSVTTAGASLFTNFENPLDKSSETFTAEDERKSSIPTYSLYEGDELLPELILKNIEDISKKLSASKEKILVIVFDELLLSDLERHWNKINKQYRILKKRSDYSSIADAEKSGAFIVGSPELVGGLEFDAVLIVACDKGRVPQNSVFTDYSRAYLSYVAHNNLYVSITRAKFIVKFLINKNRGVSSILDIAISRGALQYEE